MKIVIKGIKKHVRVSHYLYIECFWYKKRELYYELNDSFRAINPILKYWDSVHVKRSEERRIACLAHIEYY